MSYPFWLIFLSEEIRYESFPSLFFFFISYINLWIKLKIHVTQSSSAGLWYRNKWNQIYSVRNDVCIRRNVRCSIGPLPFSLYEKGKCLVWWKHFTEIYSMYNRTTLYTQPNMYNDVMKVLEMWNRQQEYFGFGHLYWIRILNAKYFLVRYSILCSQRRFERFDCKLYIF